MSTNEEKVSADAPFDAALNELLAEILSKVSPEVVKAQLQFPDKQDEDSLEVDEDYLKEDDSSSPESEPNTEQEKKQQQRDKPVQTFLGNEFQQSIKKIFADGVKKNDPIIRLFQKGYNKIPDWENSDVSKGLLEEVADLLQCRVPDFDDEQLEPWERQIANIIQGYLDMGDKGASRPIRLFIKRSKTRQWARQIGKLIANDFWRNIFLPNQQKLPDVRQHVTTAPLPEERGGYFLVLIARDHNQHTHSYSGTGFSAEGIRSRQRDREKVRDGKKTPSQFIENLIAQKDSSGKLVRDRPEWAQTLRIPPEETQTYTDLLYFFLVARIAEAVFTSQLGQYDSRVGRVQALNKLSNIREVQDGTASWRGANQNNPLLEHLNISWPESVQKELRKAYKAQYYRDHKEAIHAWRAQYYQDHKEAILAWHAQYRRDNKEAISAYLAQWRLENNYTFRCWSEPSCGRYFYGAKQANRHSSYSCPGPRPFPCPNQCQRTSGFTTKKDADIHAEFFCHKGPQRGRCRCPRGCGREFINKHNALSHANSPACVNFDGTILGQECPARCGKAFSGDTEKLITKMLQHANSPACPKNPQGLVRYMRGGSQGGIIPIRTMTSSQAPVDIPTALRSLGSSSTVLVMHTKDLYQGRARATVDELLHARQAWAWLDQTPWSTSVKVKVQQELDRVPTDGTYRVVQRLEQAAESLAAQVGGGSDAITEQYLVLLISLRAISRNRQVCEGSCGATGRSWAAELVVDVNVDTREEVTGCARAFLPDM